MDRTRSVRFHIIFATVTDSNWIQSKFLLRCNLFRAVRSVGSITEKSAKPISYLNKINCTNLPINNFGEACKQHAARHWTRKTQNPDGVLLTTFLAATAAQSRQWAETSSARSHAPSEFCARPPRQWSRSSAQILHASTNGCVTRQLLCHWLTIAMTYDIVNWYWKYLSRRCKILQTSTTPGQRSASNISTCVI